MQKIILDTIEEEFEALRSMINQLNELESLQDGLLDQLGVTEKASRLAIKQAYEAGQKSREKEIVEARESERERIRKGGIGAMMDTMKITENHYLLQQDFEEVIDGKYKSLSLTKESK